MDCRFTVWWLIGGSSDGSLDGSSGGSLERAVVEGAVVTHWSGAIEKTKGQKTVSVNLMSEVMKQQRRVRHKSHSHN